MVASSSTSGEFQHGLIVQDEGKAERILTKFVTLMLNYRFGLGVRGMTELNRAVTQVATGGTRVRCVFVIRDAALPDARVLQRLSRGGALPVFLVMPARVLQRQRHEWQGAARMAECPWESALSHGEGSLKQAVTMLLDETGAAHPLQELEGLPYPQARAHVQQRLRHINTLPTLPEIILRIMRLINNPRATTAQLEQLLCRDPAIVVKLLQVIRSPVFAGPGRQSSWSLTDIIVRLGLKKVGAIAQQIKMINSLVRPRDSGFDLRRFWEHSVGCAVIADRLVERRLVRLPGPVGFNEYWVGALLHDVGKLVLGFFFWEWFGRVVAQMEQAQFRFSQAEMQAGSVVDHSQMGELLAVNADLGEVLAGTVARHHVAGADCTSLLCLVHLADNLSKDLGMGCLPGEQGHYSPEILALTRLDTDALDRVCASLERKIPAQVRGMVEQCL